MIKLNLSILLLLVLLVSYLKHCCQSKSTYIYACFFHLIVALTFRSKKQTVKFCIWCNTGVQIHSFTNRYPVVPT